VLGVSAQGQAETKYITPYSTWYMQKREKQGKWQLVQRDPYPVSQDMDPIYIGRTGRIQNPHSHMEMEPRARQRGNTALKILSWNMGRQSNIKNLAATMAHAAKAPSGVDAMTEEQRDLIMDIHLAISAHITEQEAAHAAITMDANETITPRGRMRILQGQSKPTTYIWPRWESWTTS